ncbi:hypothetical protein RHSIM_Rhsim12G0122400 [Rhododendron simsii]|uniref:Aminotransferase-like plant mobile domain-containing protein n=1 Tax=Rhododendron simsii TaxID=118357 RepID=A0A834G3J4_RHOSS|nr:hypothetical protein RHSIM_Rhsim12G0122400 [Rhododendron simsii]
MVVVVLVLKDEKKLKGRKTDVEALVEHWPPKTHSFHLRTSKWTVTLQDVEVLLGLPVDGEPVIRRTSEDWGPMCERLLRIVSIPDVDRKGGKLWAWERFPFVAPRHLGMHERPPGSPLGAWLDHIVSAGEADPHEYAYSADDPYVTWVVQTMKDIDLDEFRSIEEEGVGAMEYLEKWLRKRPPMAPSQPQAEGVNVAEQVNPLHEPAIEVEVDILQK